MGGRYSKEKKSEILEKIRGGHKVSEVGKMYGVNELTIRTWLERETGSTASEILEVSRLKRENENLLRIIGQLTYQADVREKNQRRGSR